MDTDYQAVFNERVLVELETVAQLNKKIVGALETFARSIQQLEQRVENMEQEFADHYDNEHAREK